MCSRFLKHREVKPDLAEWPIDVLLGPIGSGKSSAVCIRILLHALEQPRGPDGWRRSKWLVIRNTNPELELTTIPTWLSWFPEDVFGRFSWSPPYTHLVTLAAEQVEMEVIFAPLDRPDQVRKLLSLELTGGWVNEGREVPREIVVELRSRCGRFPAKRDMAGAVGWAGVLVDSNAPQDPFHYLCLWGGETEPPDWMDTVTRRLMHRPAGIEVFRQPPALVPVRDAAGTVLGFDAGAEAENLANLRGGINYYQAQLAGQTVQWVLNMCCMETRASGSSRPVHPTFRRALHVAKEPLAWEDAEPWGLFAMDFARNPALVLAQEVDGQLRFLREWVGRNVSVEQFLADALPQVNKLYPKALDKVRGWGDPSGSARTGADDNTAFRQARLSGLAMIPVWTNDPDERQAALDRRLDRVIEGAPAVLFCPRGCPSLIQGLEGAFRFRRLRVTGTTDQFTEEVEKNDYSHVCEAAQYLAVGLDRGSKRDVAGMRAAGAAEQPNGGVKFDPLGRGNRRLVAATVRRASSRALIGD